MVMWHPWSFFRESPPEDPPYERLILRRITYFRPDSPIYSQEDLVEDIFSCCNVPEKFREEQGHETLEEELWDLYTERSP